MSAAADRPDGPRAEHVGTRRLGRRHVVLAVLCSLALLTYLDRIAISRVQEDIQRDLRLDRLTAEDEAYLRERGEENEAEARALLGGERARERIAWVFTAFLIGYVLFEIPGGRLGDRYGPRRVITRIVLVWSIFTALTGSVLVIGNLLTSDPSPELLLAIMIAVRFLFGLGEAGAFPNIARALGRWFPYHERARAQGFVWMASRLGGSLGPLVVGVLMRISGSWERAFWCLGAVGVVWALWFRWWYRDRPEEMAATSEAERAWIRGEVGPGAAAGAGARESEDTDAGAGSIYDDRRDAKPPWWRLVVWPNALAMYVASAAVSFSFYFFLTFLPAYLKETHGRRFADSELMSGLPIFAGCLACLLGGRASDYLTVRLRSRRWGRALPGLLGFSGAGVFMLAAMAAPGPWTAVFAFSAAFFCQDLGVPCIWSLPADIGGRHAGVLAGCMNSLGAVGGVLSPLAAVWVRNAYGWNAVLAIYGAGYLLAGAAWLFIDASRRLEDGR